MRTTTTPIRRRLTAGAVLAAVVLTAAGCGTERQRRVNADRPPLPAAIAVYLTTSKIRISPSEIGGGPIELVIANRSGDARRIVLTSPDGGEALRTTPISDGETSQAQAVVQRGTYVLRAEGLAPVRLTVGAPRPSAKDELLTP